MSFRAEGEESSDIDRMMKVDMNYIMATYHVYILTNKYHGTLYTGITRNLIQRMELHKNKRLDGFTKKYDLTRLVYVSEFSNIIEAIAAEKRIKGKSRGWKIKLVESHNPHWKDLLVGSLDSSVGAARLPLNDSSVTNPSGLG